MRHIGLRQLYPIILSKCIVACDRKGVDSCLDPMILRLPLILITVSRIMGSLLKFI